MKVAAIQHDIVWEDTDANFDRLRPQLAGAAASGAELLVLSEMYSTGFSMHPERVAEPVGGPSTAFLTEQAESLGVWICGSVPIAPAAGSLPVNRLILAGPTGEQHHYDKIHPFTYSGEHEHYAAGSGFLTVEVGELRVSMFICYDLRFADEFWALAPDTDLYVVVANWPAKRRSHWQALLTARAIENQAYVVGVNRVGEGDGLAYAGDSRIIDPLGEILASGAATEALLVAEVTKSKVDAVRSRFPFLADRR